MSDTTADQRTHEARLRSLGECSLVQSDTDACRAGADALARVTALEERNRELRAELESAADRESARVRLRRMTRRDLEQRIAALEAAIAEALEQLRPATERAERHFAELGSVQQAADGLSAMLKVTR